ncbi:LacI family transcriptional regulator [Paenibacillus sp. J31TS4]|uniref:LacI family DNA-binding transcriptional regulator n=1 Tax=Paenibacillus sp. J31TS4 TaxID=2807195 RepID=UPI001B0F9343|nr:LacI family DNA-binding transcriptional regulator [Paenibacillus sp. J31TS4]GIP37259.1 LacI family transcriptional regulator [Paenibacillus sp. J31TS4]
MGHTLETIAQLAGVSRGTVSRVVNEQPGVKPEVRARVKAVIEETGYLPNAQARSLAGGRTGTVGVAVFGWDPHFLTHHLFAEVLQGVQRALTIHSSDLLLFSDCSETDSAYWKRIGDKRKIDGLIVMGEQIRDEYLRYYRSLGLPFVLVGKRVSESLALQCVTSNYRQGAYEATKHLLGQGRIRPVYISGIPDTYHESERFAGFRQALDEAGLEPDPCLQLAGHARQQDAYEAMKRHLRDRASFDSVFAANDWMAFGAIEALTQAGRRVPEDVSVVGYDDIQAAAYFSPPLTTVRQDKIALGMEAASLLMKLLKDELNVSEPRDVIIPSELVVRLSSLSG